MAVSKEAVRVARLELVKREALYEEIGGPYPAAGVALMAVQESGRKADALTSQAGPSGFWEVGYLLQTVAKLNGMGRARSANIDPLDIPSSVYGAQQEFMDALHEWAIWLPAHGFKFPDEDDIDDRLALLKFPFSVGWYGAKSVLLAGKKHAAISFPTVSDALRAALELPDHQLPDPGPQDDDTIRRRIRKALDLVKDIGKVGALPVCIYDEQPDRTAAVKPWPRFYGAGGLQGRLRALAKARKLRP